MFAGDHPQLPSMEESTAKFSNGTEPKNKMAQAG